SSAIGVGVDGIQRVCNRLIVNVLPWTAAEFEQLKGRIYRQGQRQRQVTKIIIPLTYAELNRKISGAVRKQRSFGPMSRPRPTILWRPSCGEEVTANTKRDPFRPSANSSFSLSSAASNSLFRPTCSNLSRARVTLAFCVTPESSINTLGAPRRRVA